MIYSSVNAGVSGVVDTGVVSFAGNNNKIND